MYVCIYVYIYIYMYTHNPTDEDLFVPAGPNQRLVSTRLPGRGRVMHCRGHEEKLEPISQGGHAWNGGSTGKSWKISTFSWETKG